jgi:2-dehydropantoate 2-reductase
VTDHAQSDSPRIAVVGAGAVGCYFGGMLALAGLPVTLIGRRASVDAISRNQLLITDSSLSQRVTVEASTKIEAVREADVILLSVKTTDTELVTPELAAHMAPQAAVLSLQNGVDNVRRIFTASGISAIPCAVYVSVAITAPGHVTKSGSAQIILGLPKDAARDREDIPQKLAQIFNRAGVSCRISQNIEVELWLKLLWNCAANAVTALGRATYGQVARSALAREMMLAAAMEVVEVARAAGVALPTLELNDTHIREVLDVRDATSSTAQDIIRGKRSEIDSLNGYIVARARELGVKVPVNQTLYALVKLLEESSARVAIPA